MCCGQWIGIAINTSVSINVTTLIGDCLSQYITNHLGQLSLPSLWGR